MKYITFTIPCYNSENYMRRCVDSLLVGGEDVEILIIDDGSSDRTGAIADEYEMLYPNIVKAVHKPNGGHGSGVNKGLELAHGLYYKVVDSDDWFDRDAYLKMLDKIKSFEVAQFPDLIICNYVYDHLDEGIQKPMNYRNVFPTEKMCNWNTIGHFHPSQYLIMHALMFQTKVLRQSGVKLPEHTFYVDNLFSYQPLPYAKNLYYMDIDLYHYYLGREDQSVNEKVLMKRIDQQIRVTKLMLSYYDPYKIPQRKLRRYMILYLEIMMIICSILAIKSGTEENFVKKKEIWRYLREQNLHLYLRIRWGFLGQSVNLPGKSGRSVSVAAYKIAQKFYDFN